MPLVQMVRHITENGARDKEFGFLKACASAIDSEESKFDPLWRIISEACFLCSLAWQKNEAWIAVKITNLGS